VSKEDAARGEGRLYEACWRCHGWGGWHDCGDDCCPCLDKDEITDECDECDGTGYLPLPAGAWGWDGP
jgi:hypothetical protein